MTGSKSPSEPEAGLDAAAWRRVRIAGLVAALFAAVIVALLGVRLSRPLHDLFQNITPAPAVSSQVHVVVIDADSLRAVGGWPWNRYTIARLVEEIEGRGAKAIGLDLLFPEPDRLAPEAFASVYGELSPAAAAEVKALPPMDAVLARVIGRSPVVLARAGVLDRSFDAIDQQAAPLPPAAVFSEPLPGSVATYPRAVANLDLLDGAALGHGLVNGDPDADGVVRRVPLAARVSGQDTPGFAVELARLAMGAEETGLKTSGGRLTAVTVGDRTVPASADGRLALRFGDWRAIRTTSAADLLRQGLPADLFKDQIVLVGLTSAGTSDVVATPRAGETYGVFVQAQAVDAVLRGEGLVRPRWAVPLEWALGVLLALAAWAAVSRLSIAAVIGGAVGGGVAAFGGAWAGFAAGLLLDPFPVIVPAAATTAATVTVLFVEGKRLQARLRAALQEERIKAARIEGELAAAAEIQAGMLTPRAELARVSDAVDIDAALYPARIIGGDLYDAFPLHDGRLCFLVGDVTGKGLPAALFMALGKSLARNLLARPDLDLAAAITAINQGLADQNREDMALTLFVGALDPKDGAIDLICAGHENPLMAGADGGVREVPLRGGPPLCVDPDFPYDTETLRLAPGETLLLFSDGFTEAQDPAGALLPRPELLTLFGEAAKATSATGVVDGVVQRVRAFEGGSEPSDDLTVMAVRLNGQ